MSRRVNWSRFCGMTNICSRKSIRNDFPARQTSASVCGITACHVDGEKETIQYCNRWFIRSACTNHHCNWCCNSVWTVNMIKCIVRSSETSAQCILYEFSSTKATTFVHHCWHMKCAIRKNVNGKLNIVDCEFLKQLVQNSQAVMFFSKNKIPMKDGIVQRDWKEGKSQQARSWHGMPGWV